MAFDNSHTPNTESESRPSAVKTLRRFCFVAWHVSPFGAIAQALLDACIWRHSCWHTLWASRGLVNLIAAILADEAEAEFTDRRTLGDCLGSPGDSQKCNRDL